MGLSSQKVLLPEEKARQWIDRKLEEAGWAVINRNEFTPDSRAVAVRETLLKGNKEADYVLFLDGKAIAILEAKRHEIQLDNQSLIHQAESYAYNLPFWVCSYSSPVPFVFLSNGIEIAYRDLRAKDSQYEVIKRFPRPWDLSKKLNLSTFAGLPILTQGTLRKCQYEALVNIEKTFKEGKKRALIMSATGSGKTFTASLLIYRMLEYTPMKRVLFLVDRNNLGASAITALKSFNLTDGGQQLDSIYGIEQLKNRDLDSRTNVVVSTIQRLYAWLTGHLEDYTEEKEDGELEPDSPSNTEIELPDKLALSPDYFDLIVIDECHRSIYSEWKKVLDYFNSAYMVGMSASPIPETLAFFDNNEVVHYSYEDSVLDNVNVGFRIYNITTSIVQDGGAINVGDRLAVTTRKTGEKSTQIAAYERVFDKKKLNRTILVADQIRKVLQHYKDVVYTVLYPDREPNYDYLPKTLIFATSEAQAQLVVDIAKEVFERHDDEFVQKITYSVGNANERIRQFQFERNFRIAVTVTLVATGTDIPPLEVLIFFNDVRSETLYTQMKGRGCRTIDPTRLQDVTPNATSKDLFYLIDAIGVSRSEKIVPDLTKRDPEHPFSPSLAQLFEAMSHNYLPDDYFQLLVSKLSYIEARVDPEDLTDFMTLSDRSPAEWARMISEVLEKGSLPPFISVEHENTERNALVYELLTNVSIRNKLVEMSRGYVKEILDKKDRIVDYGFSMEEATLSTQAFETYIKDHKDDIKALQLIYNREAGLLTSNLIEDLSRKLEQAIPGFRVGRLWGQYQELDPKHVKPLRSDQQALTNLIQLVRYAYHLIDKLSPLTSQVASRFELWVGQAQRSIELDPEQKHLLKEVASYIAYNGGCKVDQLYETSSDLAKGLLRIYSSYDAANRELFSLTEFILKVA